MFKHYLKSMMVMLTLMLGMTMTVSAAYVTSLTSGKYYRIFSAYSELADKVVMFADASGMQYKVYDEGYDAMDGSMVFLATANGTFHGYDAYNLKAIGNDLYVGKAAVQWCSRGYWGDESSNTDFYIASSASAWNQCIIPMGTGGHGDAMFTDQFLIQPAHDTGSTVQQCVSLNGTAATTGFLRMNAWSDDASAPYENSIRAWSFEEVDQSTVEQILDAQDPLKNALNNLADKYESLQGGTAPGEYVKANVDAFKALYEDYLGQSAAGGLTVAQKQTMAEELTAAYDKAVSEKNTFADGTYRIVSAAKTDAKYALYVAEDGALKWKAYDEANAKQFVFDVKNLGTTYTFDGQPHEQFSLQSLATSLYVSSGNMEQNSAGMGVDGTTEENAYPVCFTYSSAVPQIIMQPMRQNKSGVSQCIAINDVNATEGIIRQTSWLNYNADGTAACWIFEPVEYEEGPATRYWQVAAEPSAPEAGKNYIIKNAYNDLYLFAGEEKGVNSPALVQDNFVYAPEYIWTLEDAGTLSEDNWEKKDALLTDASQITSNNTQSGFPTGNLLRPESDGYGLNQYIWHSSWDAPLPAGTDTYLQTTFANAEQHIIFSMISSEWNSTYDTPDIVDIYATNTPDDETSWQLITTLSDMIAIKNAHPTFYTSPHIDLGAAYTAVRFVVKQTTMKDYPARYDSNRNPYVSLGRFQVYSAVNNGTTNTSFALKSFSENAYWKYVDYASQTWDATTPYDGYDWYDYKGMNAEFGSVEEAQAFTILPAAAGDGIDGVGTEDVFDGSYVVTATEPFLNKLFKLDTQRGTNAALAPWMDSPAWLFYEVTRGTDFSKEKELALAYYDFTSEYVGTAPGLYNSDNVANYNTAKAALEAVDASDVAAMRAAIEDLADAYELALEPNPVVEGYYFILLDNAKIAENGKSTKAVFLNSEKMQTWWGALDQNDLKFVFKLTPNGDEWDVRGVETGLYAGEGYYPNAVTATVDPEYPATLVAEGEGSFRIYANNKQWCPQGNANGTADGPTYVWGYGITGPHGEASFALRPVDDADLENMVNNALIDAVTEYQGKTLNVKDAPGFCKQENADAFNDALATANDLGVAADVDTKIAAINDLSAAYVKAMTDVVPVTEGYYQIFLDNAKIAELGKEPKAIYTNAEENQLWWSIFEEDNLKFIFKVTPNAQDPEAWDLQNMENNLYAGEGFYPDAVSATEEPTYPATFVGEGEGSFRIYANNKQYCPKGNPGGNNDGPNAVWGYGITGPHGEASFTLVPVPAEKVEDLLPTAHYWEVADEPTAPESGKTYVIKNAVNDLYLIAGLGVDEEYNNLLSGSSTKPILRLRATRPGPSSPSKRMATGSTSTTMRSRATMATTGSLMPV